MDELNFTEQEARDHIQNLDRKHKAYLRLEYVGNRRVPRMSGIWSCFKVLQHRIPNCSTKYIATAPRYTIHPFKACPNCGDISILGLCDECEKEN